jgi:predicted DNA-binding ribbon-helix-helix protein
MCPFLSQRFSRPRKNIMQPTTSLQTEDESQSARKAPRSTLVSRNVTIANHRTSVRLEPEMWSGLAEICRREGGSLHEVCTAVANRKNENTSLTAAIRVFVMAYYRAAATEEGHSKTGHGYGVAALAAGLSGTAAPAPALNGQLRNPAPSPYAHRAFMSNGMTRSGYR